MRPGQPLVHWLIFSGDNNPEAEGSETYILDVYDRDGALAVFSFKEEAQMFVEALEARHGWRPVEVNDGALLKMLHKDKSSIRFIALDPLPEKLAPEAANLVCVEREYFSHYLLCRVQESEATLLNLS